MDNSKPVVSINCITYNHANYIRDCLEGFLMQETSFPFEVLIHDDASTDGTIDIIKEYQQKYPNIIKPYFEETNCFSQRKPFTVSNYSRVQGKYIAFCEGDDFWTDKEKLQMQFDFMEANPDYSMCGTGLYTLNHLEKWYCPVAFPEENFTGQSEELSFKILCCEHPFRTSTILVRAKDFWIAAPDINRDRINAPMGDLQLFFHMSLHGKIKFMHRRTSTYRQNPTSVSHYDDIEKYNSFVQQCQSTIIKIAINNNRSDWVPNLSLRLDKKHKRGQIKRPWWLKCLIWGKKFLFGYYRNYRRYLRMSPKERVNFRID